MSHGFLLVAPMWDVGCETRFQDLVQEETGPTRDFVISVAAESRLESHFFAYSVFWLPRDS
jgi:hypothetical protein